jgi:hypothetical protein
MAKGERSSMRKKAVSGVMLTLLLLSMPGAVFEAGVVNVERTAYRTETPLETMSVVPDASGPLSVQWFRALQPVVTRMVFGSSPAIGDLGPDVNRVGGEPARDLEVVLGSDEYRNFYPELGGSLAYGIWRAFDSRGNLEWARSTGTDEARSSPALADVDNDGFLDIVGGTTSGLDVEAMDRFGNFLWTFPYPPCRNWLLAVNEGMWHSSPAIANLVANKENHKSIDYKPYFTSKPLEVIIGNNYYGNVWVLDGDNSDGVNEGISYPWWGVEGTNWDVFWKFQTGGGVISTPAVGNIDGMSLLSWGDFNNDSVIDYTDVALLDQVWEMTGPPGWIPEDLNKDGRVDIYDAIILAPNFGQSAMDVVIGSLDGNVYSINARAQAKWMLSTGGPVYGSAGLADFDSDGDLEIVIGSTDGRVYFINGDENKNGIIDAGEVTSFLTGGPVFSSPAIGDVDGDGDLEVIIGSTDSKVYSFDYNPILNTVALNWATSTAGPILSSPALADRNKVNQYDKDWPMFRNNPSRTGYYGHTPLGQTLDTYIGSDDGYLYLINGTTGSIIDRFGTNGRIRTSPSVADTDGDYKLEILFYDQGADLGGVDTLWALEDAGGPGGITNPSPIHDVAVVGVTPSATSVTQGQIVSINVSVKNKGDFSETFDVATYYDANTIGTQAVSLAAGASKNLTFNWNTIGVPYGAHVIKATASIALEDYPADNSYVDGTVIIYRVGLHDIAVTNVTASPSNVTEGQTVTVEARVLNNGTIQENFSVLAYANLAIVGTQTLTLTPGESRTLTFNFGTAGFLGNYTIAVTAEAVPGETDTNNNAFIDGVITVTPSTQLHNVAINDVFPSTPTAHSGETVYINAIVANEGTETETFNVAAYINGTSLGAIGVIMNARSSQLLVFKWNTAYSSLGNYMISATADQVQNETSIIDNTFIDGTVTIGIDFHDIAVTRIETTKTIVIQNDTLSVYVDVANQGDYAETFEAVAYANATIVATLTNITLTSSNSTTITFPWDTTGFVCGNYTISAYAWPVPSETDTSDNAYTDGTVTIRLPIHDVGVANVTTSKTGCLPIPTVGQGYGVKANVTVENHGDFAETFNVTVYANATVIGTYTNVTLPSGNSTTLAFTWNTASFAKGNYTVWAYAWPVQNETDTSDNTLVDGRIAVTIPGDINGDFIVDIYDAIILAGHFNEHKPWLHPQIDPNIDINNDGFIDIYDAIILANHYNQHYP